MLELAKCTQMSILSRPSLQLGVNPFALNIVCFSFSVGWKLQLPVMSQLWLCGQRQDPMGWLSNQTEGTWAPQDLVGKKQPTALDRLSLWTVIWERNEIPL